MKKKDLQRSVPTLGPHQAIHFSKLIYIGKILHLICKILSSLNTKKFFMIFMKFNLDLKAFKYRNYRINVGT